MFRVFVFIICICLLLPASLVRAGSPGPLTIDFTVANTPAEMQPAIVSQLPALHTPGAHHFAVVSLQIDGDWALATVAALDAAGADPEAAGMGDGGALVVLRRDTSGIWQSAAEDTPDFVQLASQAPTQSGAYAVATTMQATAAILAPSAVPSPTLKFPWDHTQAWYFTQGWHYGNNVDFAPAHAIVNKWVLAAHGGVVTRLCLGPLTANLRITHPSGMITEYAHLDKTTVPSAILGKTVVQGQLLGMAYNLPFTSTDDPCGYSTGAHLHFKLPSQTTVIDGLQAHPDNTWTNSQGAIKDTAFGFPSTNVLNQGLTPRVFLPITRR